MRTALFVLVAIVSPAFAESPSRSTLAYGLGKAEIDGPVPTEMYHHTLGARVSERDWVMVTFGRTQKLFRDSVQDQDIWEVSASIGRMFCETRICLAGDAHAGYQDARWLAIDDVLHDHTPMKRRTVFGEARMAGRLDLDYVWLEASVGWRTHVGGDPKLSGSSVVSIALYITP